MCKRFGKNKRRRRRAAAVLFRIEGHDLKRETGFPSRPAHGVGVEITI
jgi:hypothetical protein